MCISVSSSRSFYNSTDRNHTLEGIFLRCLYMCRRAWILLFTVEYILLSIMPEWRLYPDPTTARMCSQGLVPGLARCVYDNVVEVGVPALLPGFLHLQSCVRMRKLTASPRRLERAGALHCSTQTGSLFCCCKLNLPSVVAWCWFGIRETRWPSRDTVTYTQTDDLVQRVANADRCHHN